MCKNWGRIRNPHVDRHLFDANPDPDLNRHQNGNSDLVPDDHNRVPVLLVRYVPGHIVLRLFGAGSRSIFNREVGSGIYHRLIASPSIVRY
jgi:hypothetical protein